MARFQPRSLTEEEIESLREEMDEQQDDIREYLESEGVDVSTWTDSSGKARADGGDE